MGTCPKPKQLHAQTNEHGELGQSKHNSSKLIGSNLKLQVNYQYIYKNSCSIWQSNNEHWKVSICNKLVLRTLGSWPTMLRKTIDTW